MDVFYVPKFPLYIRLILGLIAIVFVSSGFYFDTDIKGRGPYFIYYLFVFFWFIGLFHILKLPTSIVLDTKDNQMIFTSFLFVKVIDIETLRKIKVTPPRRRVYIEFHHKGGKLTSLNEIERFPVLIAEIKKIKPEVVTQGC